MAGWTNKGKARVLNGFFRGQALPTYLYIALVTDAAAPGVDTNTLGDLVEIAAGNGYSAGGYQLARNTSDWDTLAEDDGADQGKVYAKDVVFTAAGGAIPPSGSGARYAVLTDDHATLADREVIGFWDLGSEKSISDGQSLSLMDLVVGLGE